MTRQKQVQQDYLVGSCIAETCNVNLHRNLVCHEALICKHLNVCDPQRQRQRTARRGAAGANEKLRRPAGEHRTGKAVAEWQQ